MARRRQLSDEERAERERVYSEALAREMERPMAYVFHDTDAHDDDALRLLRMRHGWEAVGRWWHLVELLGGRKGHCYDVGGDEGWQMLAEDMLWDVEGVQGFCAVLLGLGLLSRDSYDEFSRIRSERIERNARTMAENAAAGAVSGYVRWGAAEHKSAAR